MNAIRTIFERLRQDLRERWNWYRQQRREPHVRRWWDAYNA